MTPSRSSERGHPDDGPLAVLLLDAAARIVAASQPAARHLDRVPDTLRGMTLSEVFLAGTASVHGWMERLADLREPPPPDQLELQFVRSDGTQLGFEAVLYAIRTGPVPAGECVAGLRIWPSTGLSVKSELLTTQRRVMQRVAEGIEPGETLREVAAFAERVLPGESFCMITPVSTEGVFGSGVSPTLPADVARMQVGRRLGDPWSPSTVAAQAGTRLIASDLGTEVSWQNYAEAMQRHGLIAVWSCPVQAGEDGQVRAVLDVMLPVRRPPSRVELSLMDELVETVRLAIDLHSLAQELDARGQAQRLAEAVARDRGQLLNAVVDTALDAVVSIDQKGLITLWNRQAQALFGWTSEETLGRPLTEFIIPPELAKAHEDGMARFRQTGHGPVLGRRIEITAKDRAGRRFPVELSINLIPGTGGQFSGFIRDISDRRRAEAAVKSSEERLKLVVDAASDGFWDFRLDGGPSMLSDRCAAMLGRAPEQVPLAMPPDHELVHPDDRAGVREAWVAHLEGRSPRYESEHRRRHADGSWRWIRERGKVVERNAAGEPQRVVGTQTDVTERRTLEASLGSAERLESLGLLASGFAQELDTVLSVIRAHASLANVAADLPARVVESLEVVQMCVARAKAMARSLLDMAPRENPGGRETVRVSDILRESVQLMRPTLPRTVEVSVEDRAGGHDWVQVDPAGLQQAIVNLLLHACESVANAGRVQLISERETEGRVTVACVDAGRAMGPEAIVRAFEALGPDGSLLGRSALGMASVRRFAEAMGGRAFAGATASGNRVAIELPAASDPSHAKVGTVVLHEDHPLLRPMLVEALTAVGHQVVPVGDPSLVESTLAASPAAVAVLDDLGWQRLGAEGIRRVQERHGQPIPLIVMTDQVAPAGLPAGATVLRRPFGWEQLAEAVRRSQASGSAT